MNKSIKILFTLIILLSARSFSYSGNVDTKTVLTNELYKKMSKSTEVIKFLEAVLHKSNYLTLHHMQLSNNEILKEQELLRIYENKNELAFFEKEFIAKANGYLDYKSFIADEDNLNTLKAKVIELFPEIQTLSIDEKNTLFIKLYLSKPSITEKFNYMKCIEDASKKFRQCCDTKMAGLTIAGSFSATFLTCAAAVHVALAVEAPAGAAVTAITAGTAAPAVAALFGSEYAAGMAGCATLAGILGGYVLWTRSTEYSACSEIYKTDSNACNEQYKKN